MFFLLVLSYYLSHDRLLHILQRDRVPTALLNWTASFLKDRQTSLVLG